MVAWKDILIRATREGLRAALRSSGNAPSTRSNRTGTGRSSTGGSGRGTRRAAPPSSSTEAGNGYLGEFSGDVRITYSPAEDGNADPGEVVWTWVPYEENDGRGKDRPVLVIGRDGRRVLGIMLTSKDHDRDGSQELRHGRHWMDVGVGPWDSRRRPSEVRLDRVMRFEPGAIRREGARMDRMTFDDVAAELRRLHHWSG